MTNNLDTTRSQTFTYDQLNRITSALTTSTHATSPSHCWGETYTLDAWANVNAIAATTNSNYTGCTVESGFSSTADGNNHLPSWAYDASGNATSDGVVTNYVWNAESELKSAAGVTYTYDGDGRRVSKSNGKLYWYGSGDDILAETDASGNTQNEYIFFGGKRIAVLLAGGNPSYYVEDLLGTSRVLTTNSGVVCYDADFYPYGGERSYTNTCPQNYKFEGKERDTETGNDDFGARYYSNRFGRWLSADWSSVPATVPYANLSNPQTLNLYSMVADDPESFADLDGHCEPGLNCLESNLKTAARQVANAYEKAASAVAGLVNAVGGEIGAGAGQLIGGLASGDFQMADEGTNRIGATVAPLLVTDGESAAGTAVEEGGEASISKATQLKINKAAGDAFRDEVADSLRAAGRDVKTEVPKQTPFGPRVVDIEVSHNGKTLGGVETKTGKSPYKPSQRAKDNYLKQQGYPVNVMRKPKPPKTKVPKAS